MKFTLCEIKLWFQKEGSKPKSYDFFSDKINVITGDSTTGKTSVWSIIDYCLLSANVKVPNGIYEKVRWFGIRFIINDKEISIVRKSPDTGTPSSEIYFEYGSFPDEPMGNKEIAEIKSILNIEFGVTNDLKISFDKKVSNFSYRYFLPFNALTAKLISNDDIYFDTDFFGKEYNIALKYIFDLVIGVSNTENLKILEQLKQIKKEINSIQSIEKKNKKQSDSFNKDILALIEKCKQNNFIEYTDSIEDVNEAIAIIQYIVANKVKTAENTKLFPEIESLNQQKTILKNQITAINQYNTAYNAYKKNLNKTADSLQPIEFLHKKLSDQLVNSYETKMFIDSLETSLKEIKGSLSKKIEQPLKVSGNIKELQNQIDIIDKRIDELNKIKTEYQKEGQKFIEIGRIQYALEQILKREPNKSIDAKRLNNLIEEKLRLEKFPNNIEQIKYARKKELDESIQRNYNQLTALPSDYTNAKTEFSEADMKLNLTRVGELFPLNVVGSQANYMFMHLCFFLGLHEHFINIGHKYVPQFLFIDQPSIPFNDTQDDKKKLLDAFRLLNSFVDYIINQKLSHFQIIMVEHASKKYWEENNLKYFHTVDEFIDKGLIPQDIYNG